MKHKLAFIFIINLVACSTPKPAPLTNDQIFNKAQNLISEGKVEAAKPSLIDLCAKDYGAGCSVLGGLLHMERATDYFSYYQKGCDLKDGLGCFGVAAVHYRKQDHDNFKKNIILSCTYGFEEACKVVAKLKADNSEIKAKR